MTAFPVSGEDTQGQHSRDLEASTVLAHKVPFEAGISKAITGVIPSAQGSVSSQILSLHVNSIALLPAVREREVERHGSDASQQL